MVGCPDRKKEITSQVTLKDLEIRYQNIRKQNPKSKKCSVSECNNPVDSTPFLGEDTSCAYHRLLFDFWSCDVYKGKILCLTQRGRRRLFSIWLKKTGKVKCDKIVLMMAQEPINWEC